MSHPWVLLSHPVVKLRRTIDFYSFEIKKLLAKQKEVLSFMTLYLYVIKCLRNYLELH